MSETFKQKLDSAFLLSTIEQMKKHILAAHEAEVAEVKRDLTDDKDVLN